MPSREPNAPPTSSTLLQSPNYGFTDKNYCPYLLYSRTDAEAVAFARAVANELEFHGIPVFDPGRWQDKGGVPIGAAENALKAAHEARAHAMAHSKFCLVILSPSFFYSDLGFLEIRSVVARETRENARKYIVPTCWQPNLLEDDTNDLNKLLKARRGVVKAARPREFFLHVLMPTLVQHCVALERAHNASFPAAVYDPQAAATRLDTLLYRDALNAPGLFPANSSIPVMDFKDRTSSEEETRALTGLNVIVQQQHRTMTILHDENPNETAELEERERASSNTQYFDRPTHDFILLYGLSRTSQRHARAHTAILEGLGFVVFLETKSVPPGKSLLAAVRHTLKQVPASLCVVDNSFKNSRWALEELAQLLLRGHEDEPEFKHSEFLHAPATADDEDMEAVDEKDSSAEDVGRATAHPDIGTADMDVSDAKSVDVRGGAVAMTSSPTPATDDVPTTATATASDNSTPGAHCHIRVVTMGDTKLDDDQPSPVAAVLSSSLAFGACRPVEEFSSGDQEMSSGADHATTDLTGDTTRRPYSQRAVHEVPRFVETTLGFLDGVLDDFAADARLRGKVADIRGTNPRQLHTRLVDLMEECHLICEEQGYYPSEQDVLAELGFDATSTDKLSFLKSLSEEHVCDMLVRVRSGTKRGDRLDTDRPEREHFPLTAGVYYVLHNMLEKAHRSEEMGTSDSAASSTAALSHVTARLSAIATMHALKWCWLEECFDASGRLMKLGQADRHTLSNRAYLSQLFLSVQRVREDGVRRLHLFQPNEWGVPPISEFYYHGHLGALLVLKSQGDLDGGVMSLTGDPMTVEDPQDVSKRCLRAAFAKYRVFADEFPTQRFDANQLLEQIVQSACVAVGKIYTAVTHNRTIGNTSVTLTDKQQAFVEELKPIIEHVRSEATREGFGTCAVAHMILQPRLKDAAQVLKTFAVARALNDAACVLWRHFRRDLDNSLRLLAESPKIEIAPQEYTQLSAQHVISFTNLLTSFFSCLANVRANKLQSALFDFFLRTCHPRYGKIQSDEHCLVEALMAWTLFLWGGAGGYRPTAVRIVKGRRDQLLMTFGLRNHYELRLQQIIDVYTSNGTLSAPEQNTAQASTTTTPEMNAAARKALVVVLRKLRLDDSRIHIGPHVANWVYQVMAPHALPAQPTSAGEHLLEQARRLQTVITAGHDEQKHPAFEAVLTAAQEIHVTEQVDLWGVNELLFARAQKIPTALEVVQVLRKVVQLTYSSARPSNRDEWAAYRQTVENAREQLGSSHYKDICNILVPSELLDAYEVACPIDDQLRTVGQCVGCVNDLHRMTTEELGADAAKLGIEAVPSFLSHLQSSSPGDFARVVRAFNRWWGWAQLTWKWLNDLAESEEGCVVAAVFNALAAQDPASPLFRDNIRFMLQLKPVVDALAQPSCQQQPPQPQFYNEPLPPAYSDLQKEVPQYISWRDTLHTSA